MEYTSPLNKLKIPLIISVILIVLFIVLYFIFRKESVLIINSEPGATIAISTSQTEDFKTIGTTTVSYKTTKLPQIVYMQVMKDNKRTISGIVLKEWGDTEITLTLTDPVQANPVSEGAVSYIHMDNTTIQGILTQDFRVTSFKTDEMSSPRPGFINIPQSSKIIWRDADNFIYKPYNASVGRFINGSLLGGIGLAEIATDKSGNPINNHDHSLGSTFIDVAQTPGMPTVFASSNAIYTSNNFGSSTKKIIEVEEQSINHRIFTDSKYIYRLVPGSPSDYASELEEHSDGNDHNHHGHITIYNYSGTIVREIDIPYDSIISISSTDDRTLLTSQNGLLTLTSDSSHELPLHTPYIAGSIEHKGDLIVLADSSLWKVGDNGTSLQQLFEFSANGVGVENSLSINTSGNLVFSTNHKPASDTRTTNMIYELVL